MSKQRLAFGSMGASFVNETSGYQRLAFDAFINETSSVNPFSSAFSNVNWPNPSTRPLTNVGFVAASPSILLYSFSPFRNTDWPNPPHSSSSLDTGFVESPPHVLLYSFPPFRNTDWPNPSHSSPSLDAGFVESSPHVLLYSFSPFRNTDWPNPPVKSSFPYSGFEQTAYPLFHVVFTSTGYAFFMSDG